MFDHVVIGVSNYAASKAFFEQALAPLGVEVVAENQLGVELCRPDGVSSFCIRLEPVTNHPLLHLAFTAESRQQVHAFHRAALAAGGKDNGGPGVRELYHPNYYGAFVLDPDGHNIEAVCHLPPGAGA